MSFPETPVKVKDKYVVFDHSIQSVLDIIFKIILFKDWSVNNAANLNDQVNWDWL